MTRHNIGRELLDVPMGDMIRDMAFAIAEAQIKLDSNSIDVAQMMGGLKTIIEKIDDKEIVTFEDSRVFFGKEKMKLSTALDLYNGTKDAMILGFVNKNYSQEIESVDKYEKPIVILQSAPTPSSPSAQDGGKNENVFYKVANIYWVYNPVSGDYEKTTPFVYDRPIIRLSASPTSATTSPAAPSTPSESNGGKNVNVYYYNNGTGGEKFWVYKKDDTYVLATPTAINEKKLKPTSTDRDIFIPTRLSMLELGFAPTFYQFVDTIIEVKISIKITEESSYSRDTSYDVKEASTAAQGKLPLFGLFGKGSLSVNRNVSTSHVNSSYSQKYSYSAEGSSLLRTKLVPIPPPAILEERIRQQMEIASETTTSTTT